MEMKPLDMEVHAEVKCKNSAKSENCEKEVESIHDSKDVGVPLEKPPKSIQTEISKSEPHSSTASCKKSEGHQIESSPSVDVWKCKENGNTHTQKTGDSVKEFEVTSSQKTTADEMFCAEVKCKNSAKSENCEKEVESIHDSKDVGVPLEKPPKAIQTEISKAEPHSSTASCKKSEGHQIECSPSVDVWKCKENGNTHAQKTGNSVKEFEATSSQKTTADEMFCAEAVAVTATIRGDTSSGVKSGSPGKTN